MIYNLDSNVLLDKTLKDYSWSEINSIISDGEASSHFSVGDVKNNTILVDILPNNRCVFLLSSNPFIIRNNKLYALPFPLYLFNGYLTTDDYTNYHIFVDYLRANSRYDYRSLGWYNGLSKTVTVNDYTVTTYTQTDIYNSVPAEARSYLKPVTIDYKAAVYDFTVAPGVNGGSLITDTATEYVYLLNDEESTKYENYLVSSYGSWYGYRDWLLRDVWGAHYSYRTSVSESDTHISDEYRCSFTYSWEGAYPPRFKAEYNALPPPITHKFIYENCENGPSLIGYFLFQI